MLGPWPQSMVNPIREYDWGSTTVLARMQGRPPTGAPEAELWMGAHPSSPSSLRAVDGTLTGLDALVQDDPQTLLGGQTHDRFGARLPFLLKVLAIARPLSVQVHPTADRAQASAGHDYADAYAKPEMIYALEPIDALCGFRPADEAMRLLALLDTRRVQLLVDLLGAMGRETQRLENALRALVTWPDDDRAGFAADVARESRRLLLAAGSRRSPGALGPQTRRALTWTSRLAAQHPKDPLVVAPLLLDLVRLSPGEVLSVPPGAPHAYLHGLGVEIMANSDNVLRAGLTHKPIAVEELLKVVDGESLPARNVPGTWLSPHEVAWVTDAEEFQLSRLWMTSTAPITAFPGIAGPQVLLCTSGPVTVACGAEAVTLQPGQSAFVGASGGALTLTGPGEVFRAAPGGQRLPS